MREILPIEFWPFCEVQIEMMEEEAAKHFLGNEAGWSQVYILAEKAQGACRTGDAAVRDRQSLGHLPPAI
jgi:hypothetical protein